ncbi:Aldo/keto reductase-like protein [Xylariales sp. PMI_506]|nr:Aldo/keto reductase-like protein [Xylariales sp. PMI_506]
MGTGDNGRDRSGLLKADQSTQLVLFNSSIMPTPRTLPTRKLGQTGPEVPALGLGTMGLSIGYGTTPSDEERYKVLDRAWELGATFWDTAASYGDSEVLIGGWLKLHPERRQDIFLATKFGINVHVDPESGVFKMVYDSSPEKCRASCEQSLRNLGVDYIDLFYVHRFDSVTPVEKTMETLVQLKKEGKIRHIGFSECSSDTVRRGHAIHPITAVQIEYNPWSLDVESELGTNLLSTCRELGVAIVAYSPLGRGFLTGKYRSLDDFEENDGRRQLPRFAPENFSKNLELVKIFEHLAAQKGCSPAQVVLAWILAQGPDFLPIPGTKKIPYLEENLGAVSVQITVEEDKHIRDVLVSMGGASGKRTHAASNGYADTPPL